MGLALMLSLLTLMPVVTTRATPADSLDLLPAATEVSCELGHGFRWQRHVLHHRRLDLVEGDGVDVAARRLARWAW